MNRMDGKPVSSFVNIYVKEMSIEDLQKIVDIWKDKGLTCGARGELETWIRYKQKQLA